MTSADPNPPVRRRIGIRAAIALSAATGLHGWCAAVFVPLSPAIRELDGGTTGASVWAAAGFFLGAAVAAPAAGRCADLLGARRLIAAGLAIVTVTTVLAMLAPSTGWLAVARIGMGIGTATQYPGALAALRQARLYNVAPVLTSIVLTSECTFTSAPALSTWLVAYVGWRLVLGTCLLLVLVAAIGYRAIPSERSESRRIRRPQRGWITELDVPGLALLTSVITVLIVGAQTSTTGLPWALVPTLAGLIALICWWERRLAMVAFLPAPILTRGVLVVFVRHISFYISFYVVFYSAPRWLAGTTVPHALVPAVLLIPVALTLATRSLVRTISTVNARRCLLAGATALVAACVLAFTADSQPSLLTMVILLVCLGIPNGLIIGANQADLYAAASGNAIGTLAGTYRALQFISGVFATTTVSLATGHTVPIAALICAMVLFLSSMHRTKLGDADHVRDVHAIPPSR